MNSGQQIRIIGNDFHHMRDVIRIHQGERVIILTKSGKYDAMVEEYDKNSVLVKILTEVKKQESSWRFIVWQSILKGSKMDEAIDKITEMGASMIVPVITERTDFIPKTSEDVQNKKERWQRIVISASKQARRDFVPTVSSIFSLSSLLQTPKEESEIRIFFWECSPQKNLYPFLQSHVTSQTIILLIGPEGGFSSKEASEILDHGFMEASLGNTIIRAENASFFALGMIQYLLSMAKNENRL